MATEAVADVAMSKEQAAMDRKKKLELWKAEKEAKKKQGSSPCTCYAMPGTDRCHSASRCSSRPAEFAASS
eukprot:160360-Rhodomonas_salina.1